MIKGNLFRLIKTVVPFSAVICFFGIHLVDAQPSGKPTIVLICVDDLGWKDLGYMGSTYYETPNIDQLAKQGMVFTNAYANAANCAPTRACLLTGQYTPRHGVYTVANPARGAAIDRRLVPTQNLRKISLDKITIAETLKSSGYVCAAIGKWHVGNKASEQGFDYAVTKFDMGFKRGHFHENGDYLTERTTDEAIKFIVENYHNPFYLYLAFDAVHTPIEVSRALSAKYHSKDRDGCHNHAEYAAMIESLDDGIGKINQTLRDLGLSQNTLLVFFSDNGGHGAYTCQQPLRGGKGMFYEGGIRVPMFAYWPSIIAAGSNCEAPVIGTDFYPTFMELAGASIPSNYHLDGKSLVPLIRQKKSNIRRALYWYFPAYLQSYDGLQGDSRDTIFRTRPVSAIRKGDWKLLLFHEEWVLDGGSQHLDTNNAVELYHLKKDIGEQHNLVNVRKRKRNELLDQLITWQEQMNVQMPTEPNPLYEKRN